MKSSLNICIKVDNNVIYEFQGKMDKVRMVEISNSIEEILCEQSISVDKIKSVFELFIETVQNILSYSYKVPENQDTQCHFSLSYFTNQDTYIFESCNLIQESQKEVIESKLEVVKGLSDKELRKLVRKKSRSGEDRHEEGAGLGFIMMARKSSAPIEVSFTPFEKGVLIYKQRLSI
ncbi:MAG: SiaB family protein kinase [bacterium]